MSRLKKSGLLIQGVVETIKIEAENLSAVQCTIRTGEVTIRSGEYTIRADQNF